MSKTFQEAVQEVANECATLMVAKQRDYGPKNILNCPLGADQGLIVRLFDKLARLANLTKKGQQPKNESIEDTWKDIANYGLIGLMVSRGVFELPLEPESVDQKG